MNLNWLDRNEIVELLEGACIQCYDHESTETLKEALRVNIADGTISKSMIPEKCF